MISKQTTIINKTGLHARPASLFVQEAKKYSSDIKIKNLTSDKEGDAKSMIKVMSLALVQGTSVSVEASGEDEESALNALITLIESGFDDL